jgi:predicted nuclease of predicted toxin-antitoxin system
LSLRLLVDEDTQSRRLVNLLREAGHDVLTVEEASLEAHPDTQVLEHARRENRIVLTRNCEDFRALHEVSSQHPGICAIYQDRDASQNMSRPAITRALANLEVSGLELAGQFVALNAWSY